MSDSEKNQPQSTTAEKQQEPKAGSENNVSNNNINVNDAAQENSQKAAYRSSNSEIKFTSGAKALIGGAAVATAGYLVTRSIKNFIWPTKGKIKRGLQLLLMGGTLYWATHCGSVNARIDNFYTHQVKPTVIEWKTSKQKISSLEEQVKSAYQQKTATESEYLKAKEELKTIYEQKKIIEEQLKSKDQQARLLEEKNKGLMRALEEREARLNEQIRIFEQYKTQQEELKKELEEIKNKVATNNTINTVVPSYSQPQNISSRDGARVYESRTSTEKKINQPSLEERTEKTFRFNKLLSSREETSNNEAKSSYSTYSYKKPATISKLESKLASVSSYIIYVDKDENKLSLYQNNNGRFELVTSYKCSTGINPNQKRMPGDKATPEGIFFPQYRNFSPGLDPLYGEGVIGLRTPFDGIVICGASYKERIDAIHQGRNVTNGGVILFNSDLRDLDRRVGHDFSKAVVIIENKKE